MIIGACGDVEAFFPRVHRHKLIDIAVYAKKYLQGPQTSLVYRAQAQKKVWGLTWLSI